MLNKNYTISRSPECNRQHGIYKMNGVRNSNIEGEQEKCIQGDRVNDTRFKLIEETLEKTTFYQGTD